MVADTVVAHTVDVPERGLAVVVVAMGGSVSGKLGMCGRGRLCRRASEKKI